MNDPQRDAARKLIRKANPTRSSTFWWAVTAACVTALLLSLVITVGPAIKRLSDQTDRQGRQIARQNSQLDAAARQVSDLQAQLNCRAGSGVDIDTSLGETFADIVDYLATAPEPADAKKAAIDKALAAKQILKEAVAARREVIAACAQPPEDTTTTTEVTPP